MYIKVLHLISKGYGNEQVKKTYIGENIINPWISPSKGPF
jgi:hypothetical protein